MNGKTRMRVTLVALSLVVSAGMMGCETMTMERGPTPPPKYAKFGPGKLIGVKPTKDNWHKLAWLEPQNTQPYAPQGVAGREGKFYVINTQSDTVSVVDQKTHRVLKTLKLDLESIKHLGFDIKKFKNIAKPHHAWIVPGGRYLYVGNESREHDAVWVIDTRTDEIIDIHRAGMGKIETYGMLHGAFNPAEPMSYWGAVQDRKRGIVFVYDDTKLKPVGYIDTTEAGTQVRDIIWEGSGRYAFVFHQNKKKSHIAVVDHKTRQVIDVLTDHWGGGQATRTKDSRAVIGLSSRKDYASIIDVRTRKIVRKVSFKDIVPGKKSVPRNVSMGPKDKLAYVGLRKIGKGVAFDVDTGKIVAVFECGKKANTIYIPPVANPKVGLFTNEAADFVTAIDLATNTKIKDIPTGNGSHNIAFSADGKVAGVSILKDDFVTLIDMEKLEVIADVKTGWGQKGIRWVPYMPGLSSDNPYPKK